MSISSPPRAPLSKPADDAGIMSRITQAIAGLGQPEKKPLTDPSIPGSKMLSATELKAFRATQPYQNLLAAVKTWLTQCEGARRTEEQQWYKNLDMFQGRQYTQWDDTTKRMRPTPAQPFTPQLSVNIIEPRIITQLAKTAASRPSATVAPASNDDEDIAAARAAEDWWEWYQSAIQFQHTVFNPANFWRAVCGNGFIKNFYDETRLDPAAVAGAEYAAREDQSSAPGAPADPAEPVSLSNISPASFSPQAKTVKKGMIRSIPVSPFHLYVPNMVETNLQEQPYVIHVYMMQLEAARLAYKDFVAPDWTPQRSDESQLLQLSHLGIQGGNEAAKDQVRIAEVYVKPGFTALLPNGGLVILAGESEIVAMSRDGMPYDHGEYPFGMITGIETGKFYRKSSVQSMISSQVELNRIYSQIVKHKNLAISPQMFYDQGSLNPRLITTKAGLYIPIPPGFTRPTPVPVGPLPPYVLQFVDTIMRNLDDITGQHEVSRAIAPGADTAASAISILQEKDDDYLFSTYDSIRACLETCARQGLSYVVQFWDDARLVKVTGTDASYEARTLRGADIRGNTDIRLDGDSALPKSRTARMAQITEWMDKRYIPVEVGMKVLEMGNLGKFFDQLKLDENQAVRENMDFRRMSAADADQHVQQWQQAATIATDQLQQQVDQVSQSQMPADPFGAGLPEDPQPAGFGAPADQGAAAPAAPGPADDAAVIAQTPVPTAAELTMPPAIPVNEWDNHAVHMQVHEQLLKSETYKKLPTSVQQQVKLHWEAHRAKLQQQAMENAMMDPQQSQQQGLPAAPPA